MTIDTEIRLAGDNAREFYNQMKSVDMMAIASRDAFLSDVNCELDEQGVLTIDISDLDIDLSVLNEEKQTIDVHPTLKREEVYVGKIFLQYSASESLNARHIETTNSQYCIDTYYTSNSVNTINESASIKKAA
jgi:hypothetical protein